MSEGMRGYVTKDGKMAFRSWVGKKMTGSLYHIDFAY